MLNSILLSIVLTTNVLTLDLTAPDNKSNDAFGNDIILTEQSKAEILGIQGRYGIRLDLEDVAKNLALGYTERFVQILVHSRAHDLFMTAESGDAAYNAYLLMTAAQRCLSSKVGVGESGASDILMDIATKQIDSEIRRQAVVKSEFMLIKGSYPPLNITQKYEEYCEYTNQPLISKHSMLNKNSKIKG